MKNILFGSIVAAALVFSGCGSSSSSSSDPIKKDDNSSKVDNNGSKSDVNGTTVTIGGLQWTKLKADNDENGSMDTRDDGKVIQSALANICPDGFALPTVEQINDNVAELISNSEFGFQTYETLDKALNKKQLSIWDSNETTPYYTIYEDVNTTNEYGGPKKFGEGALDKSADAAYWTCVK